jgi:hypothetical protein
MKAKRRVPGQILNPNFSSQAQQAASIAGLPYDIVPFLTLPVGEIVEDPDCWRLCLDVDAPLVPHDDECRQAVLTAMTSKTRRAFLDNLRRQNHPDVRRQMSKGQIEWLDEMIAVYGAEVTALETSLT